MFVSAGFRTCLACCSRQAPGTLQPPRKWGSDAVPTYGWLCCATPWLTPTTTTTTRRHHCIHAHALTHVLQYHVQAWPHYTALSCDPCRLIQRTLRLEDSGQREEYCSLCFGCAECCCQIWVVEWCQGVFY